MPAIILLKNGSAPSGIAGKTGCAGTRNGSKRTAIAAENDLFIQKGLCPLKFRLFGDMTENASLKK
jgi:hypothetical protein